MRLLSVPLLLVLATCGPRTEPYTTAPLPEDDLYLSSVPTGQTAWSNDSLADLFVTLTHTHENGTHRPALQRFEGPVRVGMTGPEAEPYLAFLDAFLEQINRHAGIDIKATPPPHNLLIRFVPGEEFLPLTVNQCVVLFGTPSWQEYLDDPRPFSINASKALDRQEAMTVLIPDTIEPYKVRECLLEEITQALGTANDLYGLADTIFNDDNAHTWPTRLDYLMLRVLYDSRVRSGLTKEDSQTRAAAILDEINPAGRNAPALPAILQDRFKAWRKEMHLLLQPDTDDFRNRLRSRRLERVAQRKAPGTLYDCTARSMRAYIAETTGADDVTDLYRAAIELCMQVVGAADRRIATLRLERALCDFGEERFRAALDEAQALLPVFMAHGLDDKIAITQILLLGSAFRLDDPRWEDEYLDDAAAWSAYAFGSDHDLTQKFER